MAKYLVKERSWIDNRLIEAGEEIEYDGIAGTNLEKITAKQPRKSSTDAPGSEKSAE